MFHDDSPDRPNDKKRFEQDRAGSTPARKPTPRPGAPAFKGAGRVGRSAPTNLPGFVGKTHERCEDCELRGDLNSRGIPVGSRWGRIRRCETCRGRGEIRLKGLETLDPYARKPFPARRSPDHKPWDSEYQDDIEELMAEPPHGHNHGRKRNAGGAWAPLETAGIGPPSIKRPSSPRNHGTAYTYTKIKCRCGPCREWSSTARRRLRAKPSVTTTPTSRGKVAQMPPVATDTQLSQTMQTLEACRDVIGDCVELIRSRFPDDERVQAAVEKFIAENTTRA